MARRYTQSVFSISKATLPMLQKKRLETIKEINDLESKLTQPFLEREARELELGHARIKAIYKEISELKKITQPKRGLISGIFGATEVNHD